MSRARLKAAARIVVPIWARIVLAILGSVAVATALGYGEYSGFAVIPGVCLAMTPPSGPTRTRVTTITVATVTIAVMSLLGAQASRATIWIVIGLGLTGFVAGLLPRAGPHAAAMQLPLLLGFAYSAGHSLTQYHLAPRALVTLGALPVYVVAVGLLLAGDGRGPLLAGARAALAGVTTCLRAAQTGEPRAWHAAADGLARFRGVIAVVRDAALPTDNSTGSQAARLMTVSVQRATVAAELIARRRPGPFAGTLAGATAQITKALAGQEPPPSPAELDKLDTSYPPAAELVDSLSGIAAALFVLTGAADTLPDGLVNPLPGPLARLRGSLSPGDPVFRRAVRLAVACAFAGLVASLLNLGRPYWAVFAAVIVLNAPAAKDWTRALMRICGTLAGLLLAVVLVWLAAGHTVLGMIIGLAALLPAMLLMPVNYGFATVFITATVGCLFAVGSALRGVDNLIGVAVVAGIGILLWRTRRSDWWPVARLTLHSLATVVTAPARHDNELATRALHLRAETAETTALPGASEVSAAEWTFLAAAEDLMRLIAGPGRTPLPDPSSVAARLTTVERMCRPGPWIRPDQVTADLSITDRATAIAYTDIDRMAASVAAIRSAGSGL